ncbi:MAG: hypothetical protein J3K34DRAFT_123628 [Monoraphidium minutum]|nr:MAG: hypothetical protein J3K34DRAFT_123628 [Monoraphidium minutum]
MRARCASAAAGLPSTRKRRRGAARPRAGSFLRGPQYHDPPSRAPHAHHRAAVTVRASGRPPQPAAHAARDLHNARAGACITRAPLPARRGARAHRHPLAARARRPRGSVDPRPPPSVHAGGLPRRGAPRQFHPAALSSLGAYEVPHACCVRHVCCSVRPFNGRPAPAGAGSGATWSPALQHVAQLPAAVVRAPRVTHWQGQSNSAPTRHTTRQRVEFVTEARRCTLVTLQSARGTALAELHGVVFGP